MVRMLSILKANIKIAFFIGSLILWVSVVGGAAQDRIFYRGVVNSFRLNIRKAPSQSSDVVIVAEKATALRL